MLPGNAKSLDSAAAPRMLDEFCGPGVDWNEVTAPPDRICNCSIRITPVFVNFCSPDTGDNGSCFIQTRKESHDDRAIKRIVD
jgi:hypothetical protein